jgi:hypothetical protein
VLQEEGCDCFIADQGREDQGGAFPGVEGIDWGFGFEELLLLLLSVEL